MIERPCYTADEIISDVLADRASARRLREYEKTKKPLPVTQIRPQENIGYDPDIVGNFSKASRTCEATLKMIDCLAELLKMQRDGLPFNEYVSSRRLFEGKNLEEYVKIYNDLYCKLPDS